MNKLVSALKGALIGFWAAFTLGFLKCMCELNSNTYEGISVVFYIVCIVGGALIALVIEILNEKEEERRREYEQQAAEIQRRAKEIEKREQEFKAWSQDLARKYQSVYDIYQNRCKKMEMAEASAGVHNEIWEMEKFVIAKKDERFRREYDAQLGNHRKKLRGMVLECAEKEGRQYLWTSLKALFLLKDAYKGDVGFDTAINALRGAWKRAYKVTGYISSTEYGQFDFPLLDESIKKELEGKVQNIEDKIKKHSSNIKQGADKYFEGIAEYLNERYIDEVSGLMWYYALRKEVDKLNMVEKACNKYTIEYRNSKKILTVESVLVKIYYKNQIGGMGTVRSELDYMNAWLEEQIAWKQVENCCALASGLAWMDLYELERDVLRKLVAAGMQLPEKVQERLSFLESGGTSDVKIYQDVPKDKFYFDSASTEWKTTEFDVFFRKAAMKKVQLTYSLAISKWTKTLPLASGQKVDAGSMYAEFEKMIKDFDGEVSCEKVGAQAVNLENLEYEDAVLFRFKSKRSRCVSMLFASEKYGKNLNITILTLFTPEEGIGYEELQKYAMAINENVYVESFKESILQSVDEVIKTRKTVYDEEPVRKVFE